MYIHPARQSDSHPATQQSHPVAYYNTHTDTIIQTHAKPSVWTNICWSTKLLCKYWNYICEQRRSWVYRKPIPFKLEFVKGKEFKSYMIHEVFKDTLRDLKDLPLISPKRYTVLIKTDLYSGPWKPNLLVKNPPHYPGRPLLKCD